MKIHAFNCPFKVVWTICLKTLFAALHYGLLMDDVHLAVCLSLLIRYWQEECCNSAIYLRLLSSHWLRNKHVHICFTQNHDVWETTCSVLLWCLKTINTRTGSVTCLSELLGAAYLWSKETDVLALQLQLWPSKPFPSFYHFCSMCWPHVMYQACLANANTVLLFIGFIH